MTHFLAKNGPKNDPKNGQKRGPFFDPFLVQKWPKNDPFFGPLLEKTENVRQRKSAVLINFFRSIFGQKPQVATCTKYAKITHFWPKKTVQKRRLSLSNIFGFFQKWSKNWPVFDPFLTHFLTHFWTHFLVIFGPIFWPFFGPKWLTFWSTLSVYILF